MKIAWDNKADAAALTVGSELATQPGSNVQNEHISRKWQSAAGVNSSFIVFDMLASVACDVLALLGTNLTSAGTVRLRASDTDPAAISSLVRDTGTLGCGVKSGYGAVYKAFVSATARYWRLDVSDATLSALQLGRVVIAPTWAPSVGQLYDWGNSVIDESGRVKSYGGQWHSDVRPKRRAIDFIFDYMNEAEMYGNAFRIAYENGITKDVLVIPDINGAYLSEQAVWGALSAGEPIRLTQRLSQIYRQSFSVEERL